MRRFFRSAAFPILIVIVLAFFAQRLISPGEKTETPSFNEFLAQIESRQIDQVTINTKDNTVDVKGADGKDYSTGYPDNFEQPLVNRLERNDVKTEVKGRGGGGLLNLLTYILPFLLFFGFWIFLMNQMQG
ncbi:MAG: ATP-dependent metallopeptidase FtsH/Yme1/Tma family protein, partial [Solirubrobacterales bacterium]